MDSNIGLTLPNLATITFPTQRQGGTATQSIMMLSQKTDWQEQYAMTNESLAGDRPAGLLDPYLTKLWQIAI